jgi:hypothetical protein
MRLRFLLLALLSAVVVSILPSRCGHDPNHPEEPKEILEPPLFFQTPLHDLPVPFPPVVQPGLDDLLPPEPNETVVPDLPHRSIPIPHLPPTEDERFEYRNVLALAGDSPCVNPAGLLPAFIVKIGETRFQSSCLLASIGWTVNLGCTCPRRALFQDPVHCREVRNVPPDERTRLTRLFVHWQTQIGPPSSALNPDLLTLEYCVSAPAEEEQHEFSKRGDAT